MPALIRACRAGVKRIGRGGLERDPVVRFGIFDITAGLERTNPFERILTRSAPRRDETTGRRSCESCARATNHTGLSDDRPSKWQWSRCGGTQTARFEFDNRFVGGEHGIVWNA